MSYYIIQYNVTKGWMAREMATVPPNNCKHCKKHTEGDK